MFTAKPKSALQERIYYILVYGDIYEMFEYVRENGYGEFIVFEGRTTKSAAIAIAERYASKAYKVAILNRHGAPVAGWTSGERTE